MEGKTIEEIVDYRYSLVRGCVRANVSDAQTGLKNYRHSREIAMSTNRLTPSCSFQKDQSIESLSAKIASPSDLALR